LNQVNVVANELKQLWSIPMVLLAYG